MDASQYKDYILVLLFMRYVSDKYGGRKDALIEVPEGGSFQDMVSLRGKAEIGDGINKIIRKLAEANDLRGVIDVADFNDDTKLGRGKDMQDRLSNLIAIFQDEALDFSKNKVEGDDILGDAYEYLMRHFATESGKSKGQFYTPAEVSRVIAKVIGISHAERKDQTLYDPTCGSGSLLLKAAYETPHGITIYGQENDVATRALAVMNMWLHENPDAVIWRDNTISSPYFRNEDGGPKTFDFVVANPPFSTKSWSNGINPRNDKFGRFVGYGIPPKKNGDYAFFLHIIKSLKTTGKGAIILPHGVLFRGGAEAEIRQNIIKRGYIKGIIGLPTNLFYGTGIPACIIVLDKENAESRKGIFMIDASKGFFKDGNKNRLRERDIRKIVDVFTRQVELPKYSRMVPLSEISNEKNDYNLNIPRYIDSQEDEDLQDIEAHLKGDIPEKDINDLTPYWRVYPSTRQVLFSPSKRLGYSMLKVDRSEIRPSIFDHSEFKMYSRTIERVFLNWKTKNLHLLNGLEVGSKPKKLILAISESLLEAFSNLELVDKYDVYQHLMTYWTETMQDDAYLIAQNGWKAEISTFKNKKGKETGWECDLIPKNLVIDKYFSKQKDALEVMQRQLGSINQQMQALDEENEGEDDVFSEARSKTGEITEGAITKRIAAIKKDPEFVEELKVLTAYRNLMDREAELKRHIKAAATELDKNLLIKYRRLTEAEIKKLVVEDKWLASIHDLIDQEIKGISRKLAGRITELADRYRTPLPALAKDVLTLTKTIDGHLEKMGFRWQQ
jgi:type I restriction enzyme M protein